MIGFDGNDTIRGYAGDDSLAGGNGNDKIYAGAGADFSLGGIGNDLLVSNRDAAQDVFIFGKADGSDTITGFEDGRDKISIDGIAFSNIDIRDRGADALVLFGATSVLIRGIDHTDLTAADFILT